MSLLTAIGNFQGAGIVQNPYLEDYKDKVRLKFAEKASYADPVELAKVRDAESFRNILEARAAASIERPTMSEMIERGVDHVDAKQKYAGNQVRMIMTGESDNLHEAMIAMEESGVAFNLMLETRNKLMAAYQELLRMQ